MEKPPEGTSRSNGNLPILGGIVALLGLIGGVTAIVRPMQQLIDHNQESIQRLQHWQDEYSLGHIPSASAPKMAEVEQKFVEVETQFRAFRERIEENERLMIERWNTADSDTRRNREWIEKLRVIAGDKAM